MYLLDSENARAVLFFGSEGVVKELQYPEFEALLDGFVPLEEWSNRKLKAVYVEVNSQLCVVAAVFFQIGFDPKGAIEASWNMPLGDLARTPTRGPDLGAGPIHLACATQCPIAFYKDALWDPDMSAHSSHFNQIKKALKRNRLGLLFEPAQNDESNGVSAKELLALEQRLSLQLGKSYQNEMRDQLAQLLKDQRLRIATINTDKENALNALRLEYAHKMEALQQQLEEKEAQIRDLGETEAQLKAIIDGQAQKIEGLREYYEHKLKRGQGVDQDSLDAIKAHYQQESEEQIAAAGAEFETLLKMKEVELQYRSEREQQLTEEVNRLRSENHDLVGNSGDHLLEKLSRQGINFVTYQSGAGHITIPVAEIPHFLDNPVLFTANYCGVSEKHYLAWLQHYQTPVCSAKTDTGDICCVDIPRITTPAQFIMGESDVCTVHNRLRGKEKLKIVKS